VTKRDNLIARLVQNGCPITALGRTFGISQARVRQIADKPGIWRYSVDADARDWERLGETLDAARAIISEVPAGYIGKIKREMEQQ
jgi:hypothetical protein